MEAQRARIEAYLNQAQQVDLRLLMDHVASQSSIEEGHLFQAALSLSKELNRLTEG